MKTNKILRIFGIVTVLVIVLAFAGKRLGWFGKAETFEVVVEQGDFRTIVETISANGKINPETEVKISPDVSGEIVELHVKEGEYVKRGTLLAKIKPDTYISARERALAALNSAKARLAQTEANFIQAELSFNRNKQLWEQKTISRAEFEQAEASYKMAGADVAAAEASVKSAEASLKEANEELIKTTIYAPIDGTIYGLLVEQGERVVGTSLMSGTEMMRIADLNRMEVVVEVNENDIVRVEIGDTAIIEVDAYLDHEFKGVVTEIANSATTTGVAVDQVTSFNVNIFLLKESYIQLITPSNPIPFRPGMSATVDIQTNRRTNILSIPIQAVTTRSDTTDVGTEGEFIVDAEEDLKEVVFVVDEVLLMVFQREVETGIQDNNFIEIILGLDPEEKVVVAPYSAISRRLADSSLVEIVTRDELFESR
jgi:HlyD family secretion protein